MSLDLKSKLEALEASKPRTFKQWLNTTDAEQVELVMRYVKDTTINPYDLADTLRASDIPITAETIKRLRP